MRRKLNNGSASASTNTYINTSRLLNNLIQSYNTVNVHYCSVRYFIKEMNTINTSYSGCIKLISGSKETYIFQFLLYFYINVYISNKYSSFELSTHLRILKKNYYVFHKNIKPHNCFQHEIRNVSSASNQHIRMISEGSCDTKDWSNACRKFSFASQE